MAYTLAKGGSDWTEIHVLRVSEDGQTTTKLPDVLTMVKFSSLAWTHDNKGFFYNRWARASQRSQTPPSRACLMPSFFFSGTLPLVREMGTWAPRRTPTRTSSSCTTSLGLHRQDHMTHPPLSSCPRSRWITAAAAARG